MSYKYVVVFSNIHLNQRKRIIKASNQKEADAMALRMHFPRGYALDFVQKVRE
jgi:hypothetical protein